MRDCIPDQINALLDELNDPSNFKVKEMPKTIIIEDASEKEECEYGDESI